MSLTKTDNSTINKAIKQWKINPNINPYNNSKIKTSIVLKSEYVKLYEKFITYLTKDLSENDFEKPEIFENIRKQLPTNHIYVFKEIDYLKNLKQKYNDPEEDKWIDFLITEKKLIYSKEKILDKKGYTVYDHLFMHFYFIKNKNYLQREKNIYNQNFLYEIIENQIKLINAVDLNCYEIIDSMLNFTNEQNKGINFEIKKIKNNKELWPYYVPPLLKLFIEYIYEISYYLISIKTLKPLIFNEYFLYSDKNIVLDTKKKIQYIDNSIKYNKYRLKTILNIILGSMYNNDNSEKINIKTFLKILWKEIKNVILEEQKPNYDYYNKEFHYYLTFSIDQYNRNEINKEISEVEIKNLKLFFVSSIFDIETIHKESQDNFNVIKYEPVIDPYNNLPQPPEMPQKPIISQELEKYRKTSDIKDPIKEKELKEYLKKEKEFKQKLKSYDKKLKEYNEKYLDKKLSPYFSIKLSRAKSEINDKNSLRLSYSPLKVSPKSLTNFKSEKNKKLLEKFEKEPYSRSYKQKEIASQDIESYNEEIDEETLKQRELERQRIETFLQEIETDRERLVELGRAQRERDRNREQMFQLWQEREGPREREREWLRARSDSISSHYSESPHSDIRSRSGRSSSSGHSSSGYSSSGGAQVQKQVYVQMKGGSKTKYSESDLKLRLALEADKFKKYAKSLSSSGKSPRQKYIGCDLNDNDPLTLEKFSDMHFKKIKYLSKIKTKLPDGKIITLCYDTIPFYNYILDCKNKGNPPLNLKMGQVPLTIEQQNEVFKKIKFFTKQPTLKPNINKKKFLKAKYIEDIQAHLAPLTFRNFNTYTVGTLINIGSINFHIIINYTLYNRHLLCKLHRGPIISNIFQSIPDENTSNETFLLIQKGIENGSLLKINTYPYWKEDNSYNDIPFSYKLLKLPNFSLSNNDTLDQLKEKTRIFNNSLRQLIY
jgi:hypothetical protein